METYDQVSDNISASKKREYWDTAFGLQEVDSIKPSDYLKALADEHVAGKKTYYEVSENLTSYYQSQPKVTNEHEADFVSEAIYSILADEAFSFNILTFKSYHRRLFEKLDPDVFRPGEFRTVNITKKEPILSGDTVQYQDYGLLDETLKYDFSEEANINYLELTNQAKIARLAEFTSHIWQVHPFLEGNTRTTAVFIEKYLRSLGFTIDNELFEKHSLYFRNALVRANYSNLPKNISATLEYLVRFFENLLLGVNNNLDNSSLYI